MILIFLQFLFIQEGINPKSYFYFKIKTSRITGFKEVKSGLLKSKLLKYEIPLEIEKPYPLKGTNSFHFKIGI